MGRFSKSAAAFGIAALLIVGGGANALASGGSKISVCVKHKGGTLYKAKKCAKHDKKLNWNSQGPQGAQGQQGAQGPQGAQGQAGAKGAPGSALAYAHVLFSAGIASFDLTQTAGMGSATVTAEGLGGFCFGNLPFIPHNATASIDWTNGASEEVTAQISIVPGGTALSCPTGDPVRVETINANTSTEEHSAFYITFN